MLNDFNKKKKKNNLSIHKIAMIYSMEYCNFTGNK